jgi:hypothetical protein
LNLAGGEAITCTTVHPIYIHSKDFVKAVQLAFGNAMLYYAASPGSCFDRTTKRMDFETPHRSHPAFWKQYIQGCYLVVGSDFTYVYCRSPGQRSQAIPIASRIFPSFGNTAQFTPFGPSYGDVVFAETFLLVTRSQFTERKREWILRNS